MFRATALVLVLAASMASAYYANNGSNDCGFPVNGACPTGCFMGYGACYRSPAVPSATDSPVAATEAPCGTVTDPTPTCPAGSTPGQEVDGLCCCAAAPTAPATTAKPQVVYSR